MAKGPKKEGCLAVFLRRRPIEHSRKVMLKIVKTLQDKVTNFLLYQEIIVKKTDC